VYLSRGTITMENFLEFCLRLKVREQLASNWPVEVERFWDRLDHQLSSPKYLSHEPTSWYGKGSAGEGS